MCVPVRCTLCAGGAAGKKLAKAQKAPGLPAQPKEVTPVWGGFTYSSSVLSAQEQQTQQTSLRSIQVICGEFTHSSSVLSASEQQTQGILLRSILLSFDGFMYSSSALSAPEQQMQQTSLRSIQVIFGGHTHSSSVLSAREQQTQQSSLHSLQVQQEVPSRGKEKWVRPNFGAYLAQPRKYLVWGKERRGSGASDVSAPKKETCCIGKEGKSKKWALLCCQCLLFAVIFECLTTMVAKKQASIDCQVQRKYQLKTNQGRPLMTF
eukprot:1140071-Pelagomonas_calceolata.AAC.1